METFAQKVDIIMHSSSQITGIFLKKIINSKRNKK